MRVLVVGGSGMLGHQLALTLGRQAETHITVRTYDEPLRSLLGLGESRVHAGVDVSHHATLTAVLTSVRPDVVINCIGLIKQIAEAKDPVRALEINALFPHRLALACGEVGARMVQISTDCVFSGRKGDYTESDVSDAEDLYGRTKFLGEVAGAHTVTLRTSIVGTAIRDNVSLFDWFLSRREGSVRGFAQAIYTGLTTERLATEIGALLQRPWLGQGVWHVASQKISKYELLRRLGQRFAVPVEVIPDYDFKCDRSLCCDRYQATTGFSPPSWDDMIEQFAATRARYTWKST